jgi:5-methylcytosine-specific restriction protein B
VAFLRRFATYRLYPSENKLREYLGIPLRAEPLKESCENTEDILDALIRSWSKLNDVIELTKGADYQIGHGLIMGVTDTHTNNLNLDQFLPIAKLIWTKLYAHLAEVYYGDAEGLAATLNAGSGISPYSLEEKQFANNIFSRLKEKEINSAQDFYNLFKAISSVEYADS